MKKFFTNFSLLAVAFVLFASFTVSAQNATTDNGEFKPSGKLWGYAFGDYAFKANADTSGIAKFGKYRGGSNQYTNINWANNGQNMSLFQLRRVYLGYNYDITAKFSAEFLLAAEDDFNTAAATTYTSTSTSTSTTTGTGTVTTKTTTTTTASNPASNQNGDLLADGKFAPYLKLCNLRWKQIYPGADLVFGEVATPSFPLLSEVVWNYRSIERTVSDIRRTPSFDLGATIQGRFVPSNDNFGYNVMVGNGQSAKVETNGFKWFYGDVYAKFFDKHLIIDLYQDYYRLNWTPTWHHDRNMTKIFVAWSEPKFTVGVEAFTNTLNADVAATGTDGKTYYFNTVATAVSMYVRGKIYKDKWSFFARYDMYNPTKNLSSYDGSNFTKYSASTSQYDPTNKENFLSLGFDYTPFKNIHVMPNIWYNAYSNQNSSYTLPDGNDMVYRLTFYYIYGK